MRLAMILFGLVFGSLPASAQDKKRPDILNISKTGVFGLAFSPDGKMLAAGAVGRPPLNGLKVWDAESWELKTSFTGHTNHIWDVAAAKQTATFNVEFSRGIALSKDGRYVALGTRDSKVRIWDVSAKKELPSLQDKSLSSIFGVAFSSDGNTLAAGGMGKVRLWSWETK